LLELLVEMVDRECGAQHIRRTQYRFSRRAVREYTRWGDTQLKIHLGRLTELEYVLVHRGGRGQSFEYELLYDGSARGDGAHVSGLLDIQSLRQGYDAERSGCCAPQSGVGRGVVGGQSAGGREDRLHSNTEKTGVLTRSSNLEPKTQGTVTAARSAAVS
jgi:DNA primase